MGDRGCVEIQLQAFLDIWRRLFRFLPGHVHSFCLAFLRLVQCASLPFNYQVMEAITVDMWHSYLLVWGALKLEKIRHFCFCLCLAYCFAFACIRYCSFNSRTAALGADCCSDFHIATLISCRSVRTASIGTRYIAHIWYHCRCTGESDINPVGSVGKVTQLLFAALSPHNVVTNLLSATIAAAGASQSADMVSMSLCLSENEAIYCPCIVSRLQDRVFNGHACAFSRHRPSTRHPSRLVTMLCTAMPTTVHLLYTYV